MESSSHNTRKLKSLLRIGLTDLVATSENVGINGTNVYLQVSKPIVVPVNGDGPAAAISRFAPPGATAFMTGNPIYGHNYSYLSVLYFTSSTQQDSSANNPRSQRPDQSAYNLASPLAIKRKFTFQSLGQNTLNGSNGSDLSFTELIYLGRRADSRRGEEGNCLNLIQVSLPILLDLSLAGDKPGETTFTDDANRLLLKSLSQSQANAYILGDYLTQSNVSRRDYLPVAFYKIL